MTNFSGYVQFTKQHRLYPHLNSLLIFAASLTIAAQHYQNGTVSHAEGDFMTVQSGVLDVQIRLPIFGPIQLALENKEPDGIDLFFEKKPIQSPSNPNSTAGFRSIVLFAITPLFVEFFEGVRPWLKQNVGNNPAQWPSVWDFGRVVRNACSHGGKLDIRNASSPPVHWHHLQYDSTQHGKQIIGTDLGFADLLILMIEMSDELDSLGCPV